MSCGGSTFTNYFLCSQKSRAQLFVCNSQSYLNTIIERNILQERFKHLELEKKSKHNTIFSIVSQRHSMLDQFSKNVGCNVTVKGH